MPKKRNRSSNLANAKTRAGKILSDAINKIAKEETETAMLDGEDVMITKAHALARLIWKSALGYTVTTIEGVASKQILHPPSLAHQQILLDRMEGKVAAAEPEKKENKSELADRLSKEATNRINSINE
ncbi:MAG TPA: hypothetical protein ENH82_07325 [bacterium]|nr:hypothetical protein [bacterium]